MATPGAAGVGGAAGGEVAGGCGASGELAHSVGAAVRRELEPLISELIGAAVRRELEPLVSKLAAIEEMLRPVAASGAAAAPTAPRGTVLSQTPAEVRRISCHAQAMPALALDVALQLHYINSTLKPAANQALNCIGSSDRVQCIT